MYFGHWQGSIPYTLDCWYHPNGCETSVWYVCVLIASNLYCSTDFVQWIVFFWSLPLCTVKTALCGCFSFPSMAAFKGMKWCSWLHKLCKSARTIILAIIACCCAVSEIGDPDEDSNAWICLSCKETLKPLTYHDHDSCRSLLHPFSDTHAYITLTIHQFLLIVACYSVPAVCWTWYVPSLCCKIIRAWTKYSRWLSIMNHPEASVTSCEWLKD